jgi:2'-5' RNA ligase
MVPDEITPIWGPDDESILTFVTRNALVLPQGKIVLAPDPGSARDPSQPTQTMIAFKVEPEVASQYGVGPSAAAQAQQIPLDERHITLVYMGEQDELERRRLHDFSRRWLAKSDWPPLDGKAQGWGTFIPGGEKKPVLWMSWDIPGLNEMRADLVEELRTEGFEFDEEHDFTPHETVAYMEDGEIGELPPFPDEAPAQTFNAVIVGEDDKWTEYPMPMAMSLLDGASMSLTAALNSAVTGMESYTDEELDALIAAGGADRNRGNAERLRRYWTIGKGGAKIRWNTKGDWKRCVKYLSKHLGPRAKGYCALRHKEMTRMWTGDMKHRIMYGWGGKPGSYWAKVAAHSLMGEDNAVLVAMSGEPMPEENPILMMLGGPQQQSPVGFQIPLLLPEGIESGDGRTFKDGVVAMRELPIPLLWQPNSMQGHDGAAIVGRIDHAERVDGGIGNATGVFDSSPLAQEAVRMIREGFLRGVSADLDQFEAKIKGKGPGVSEAKEKKESKDEDETITPDKMDILKGRIMAATLVAKPAFEQCVIKLIESGPPPDGEYIQSLGPGEQEIREALAQLLREEAQASFAITASAGFRTAPIYPPKAWFDDPQLMKRTHLSIDDDGRVYGHIAAWDVNHIGMNFGVRPPKSRSGYAYFRTGLLRTEEGSDVRVGQLTLAGGHASLQADVREAVRHYDDTASAWADVAAGEDRFGIWVAGALRPTVTQEQVRAARASSPSGDWRPINGTLELVAVCSVNVPGFPVVEARVASGQVLALVAAGIAPLYSDQLIALDPHAAALAARERMYAPMQAKALALSAKMARARVLSQQPASVERRKAMTSRGWAMAGGKFPIADLADLERAIKNYSRVAGPERKEARNHIALRAHALGHSELIPIAWTSLSSPEFTLAARVNMEFGITDFRDYSSEKRDEMAKAGEAMKGGRYPIANVADLKKAIKAYGRGDPKDKPAIRKHIMKRARSLGHPELIPDTWKNLSLDEFSADEPSAALFRDYSTEKRKELEKSGAAMKGGGYPIKTVEDLKNAIKAYGRAKESERAAVRKHIMKRARALGKSDLIPEKWTKLSAWENEITETLLASVRTLKRSEWDERKVSRDDVGRFRKIYYRLRNSPGSGAPEIRAALKAVKEAARISAQEGLTDPESAATARDALDEASVSSEIDERTQVEVIKAAEEMANIMRRFEVRGSETMISFDQLPTEIQDAMKRYMKQSNLEERISKHFDPLISGEVQRSVEDIVNFLERIIVDSQKYHSGYDSSRV